MLMTSCPRSLLLFLGGLQTTGQSWQQRSRGCMISERGNCRDEILLSLSGIICVWCIVWWWGCKESFSHVILPTRAESYAYWQCSVTASTQQAPLHLHTECVLLYLFIRFHVAKCCHFDEWEMEPANCFHSMGQVSHALNLNVLLVWGALPCSAS